VNTRAARKVAIFSARLPAGRSDGYFFLLMEFVDGVNLRELLRARRLTPEEALAIVPPLCEALQYAHERGIVHRDIKPENLLLAKDRRIKVVDFGIAKMLGAKVHAEEEKAASTPGYMAPEQRETPQRVDSRADI
jgi:serine/threonine protein kinase